MSATRRFTRRARWHIFKTFHSEEKILDRSRAGTVLVVEEEDELTATGSMVDGEIFAVFVAPNVQQGGRGKALMEALEQEARRQRRQGI